MHQLLHAAIAVCVIGAVGFTALAWRLEQGPMDVSWLSNRARAALIEDGGPVRVSFSSAELAWGGVSPRLEHLLVLQFSGVVVQRNDGTTLAQAPRAWTSFSLPAILVGQFVPRVAEVDNASFRLPGIPRRDAPDGTAPVGRNLQQMVRSIVQQINPANPADGGVLEHLRRIRVNNARLEPFASAAPIAIEHIDIDVTRQISGRLVGDMEATVSTHGERSQVAANLDVPLKGDSRVNLTVGSLKPSALVAWFQAVAGIDVPVSGAATMVLDHDFAMRHGEIAVRLGAGSLRVAQGTVPIQHGSAHFSGTPDAFNMTQMSVTVAASANGRPTSIQANATANRQAGHLATTLNLGFQDINLAELPRLWPDGVGGGARAWVVEHVKVGRMERGSASFSLDLDEASGAAKLNQASADLSGSGVGFTWLDQVPGVDQADVRLRLLNPDVLEIDVRSGRQRGVPGGGDLRVSDGVVRISGLSARDQTAGIHFRTDGPVTSVLEFLKLPRLHLLSEHPINFKVEAGTAAGVLDFTVPLVENVLMDDVGVHATVRLTDLRAPRVVGDADLDAGSFNLAVAKDGLHFDGTATLAQAPMNVQGTMDFTVGPPNQIMQKIVVTGRPDAAVIRQIGLDLTGIVMGQVPVTATIVDRRRGPEEVGIDGDLTDNTMAVDLLAWKKPAGVDAKINVGLTISHGQLAGLDRLLLTGHELLVSGSGRSTNDHLNSIVLDEVSLGQTRARGTVRFVSGQPINIVLAASVLDLAPKLTAKLADTPPDLTAPKTKPSWTIDVRCSRLMLANGVQGTNVLIKGRGDGEVIRTLDTLGSLDGPSSFSLKIQYAGLQRHLRLEAQDGGLMLQGLDIVQILRGGQLVVDGSFDDPDRYAPLTGTAAVYGPRMMQTPAVGKLLQAITIYGLADVMRGPGIGLTKIDIPFVYDGAAINITSARAYNPSLGITAHGRIGTRAGRVNVDGTVVPAYVLNSALGNLPVLGRLFSAEKGGGLFAVRFNVSGDLDNPVVWVNPASALTPGFLRGLFGTGEGVAPGDDGQAKK